MNSHLTPSSRDSSCPFILQWRGVSFSCERQNGFQQPQRRKPKSAKRAEKDPEMRCHILIEKSINGKTFNACPGLIWSYFKRRVRGEKRAGGKQRREKNAVRKRESRTAVHTRLSGGPRLEKKTSRENAKMAQGRGEGRLSKRNPVKRGGLKKRSTT